MVIHTLHLFFPVQYLCSHFTPNFPNSLQMTLVKKQINTSLHVGKKLQRPSHRPSFPAKRKTIHELQYNPYCWHTSLNNDYNCSFPIFKNGCHCYDTTANAITLNSTILLDDYIYIQCTTCLTSYSTTTKSSITSQPTQ